MEHNAGIPGRRAVAGAELVTIAGFAGLLALSGSTRIAGVVVTALGAIAVVVLSAMLVRSRRHRTLGIVSAASAVGLVGSLVYLHSVVDVPTAIPVGGMGGLFVSLVGLGVTAGFLAIGGSQQQLRR